MTRSVAFVITAAACSHPHNDDPHWSPDGKRVLFSTDRGGQPELWVMDADGSHEHRIAANHPGPGPGDASRQPVEAK